MNVWTVSGIAVYVALLVRVHVLEWKAGDVGYMGDDPFGVAWHTAQYPLLWPEPDDIDGLDIFLYLSIEPIIEGYRLTRSLLKRFSTASLG